MNKNDLIFIVEDTDGNKFGEYLHEKISGIGERIGDSKAFLFSLKSPGRNIGFQKFEFRQNYAFKLWNDEDFFFVMGSGGADVLIYKKSKKSKSYVQQQNCFNYHGIQNALIGKMGSFTPK